METEVRERHVRWGSFAWPEFPEMFAERLAAEDLSDATVLDLGTGEGRLALSLAPRARIVVGIDTDEEALEVARDRAHASRISNVTFLRADADTANYRLLVRSPIDVVVSSFFMSEAAIRETAKALRTQGRFLFACHHDDNWIESGRTGRFSFGESAIRGLLEEHGMTVRFLGVDRLVVTYADLAEFESAHPTLAGKFRRDGRWETLRSKGDPVRLTWAALVGVAAKG